MKKLILLFLIIPELAFANDISTLAGKAISAISTIAGKAKADIATVGGGGVPAAAPAAFCDCSGDVTFCWEITADNTTITSSGGCVDSGDSTATANSTPSIAAAATGKTGYAITWTTASDYYYFDVTSDDLISDNAGTLEFDVYFTTLTNGMGLFHAGYDDNNRLYIYVFADTDLRARYVGNTTAVNADTSGAALTTGAWYTVTMKWTQSDVDPNLSINVNSVTGTSTTNLTNFATASNVIRFGEIVGNASGAQIKNIRIYNSWQ